MAKSTKSRPASKSQQPAPLEGNAVWRARGRVRRASPTVREKSTWETLPDRLQHAICVGFLLLVTVGFYSATVWGGRSLAGGDTVQWRAAAEAGLEHEARTGERALWAPNVFGGMPSFLIDYPPAAPGIDTVFNGLRKLGWWPTAHTFLLLIGTYLLVVYLTRAKLAGVISAVAFGLTTYLPIILTAGHNSKYIALAWAPWLLLAFAAVIRRPPGSTKSWSLLLTLFFAIAASLNLRAGHIQVTYYVVWIAAIWWIAEGIADARTGTFKTFLASTGLLLLGSAVALLMVAHPYLAQWEYKAFTIRASGAGGGLDWLYAMEWSQGFGELLTLLIPNAYGGASPLYWGPKIFTAGPHYVGPVVLLLALVGVAGVARRSVAAFGVAALVMAAFSLGQFLPVVNRLAFEAVPLFNAFRVPETWLVGVALVLALLAGWGAYYVQRREATVEAEGRKLRQVGLVGGVLALGVAALWLTGGAGLDFQKAGEREQIEAAVAQQAMQQGVPPNDPRVAASAREYLAGLEAERADAFAADAGRTLLFLLLGLGAALAAVWRGIPAWAGLAVLALLVTADLWGVGRRYFNEDADALRRRANVASAIPRTAADDFILARQAEAGGPGHFRVLPPSPVSNARPSYFYESVGGYSAARLALAEDYFDTLLPGDGGGFNRPALDLLAVRYVLDAPPQPGLVPVFQDPATGSVVLENPSALPRAFLVDSVAVVADRDARIAALRDSTTDLRRVALLSAPAPAGVDLEALTGAPPDSGATAVGLERFTPNEIVVRVQADRPRLLVLSEVYYPAGWTATVEGRAAPILQTDHLLRGVPVPAGESLVTLRFRPESDRRGRIISWIATLLVYAAALGLGGVLWYRRGTDA